MTKKTSRRTASADLDKLRRHIRILVDLGLLAGQNLDIGRFFDQAVIQVARAVEIEHVKIMRYRPQTADLLMEAGVGWKEGVVKTATFPIDLRSPPGRTYLTGEPTVIADISEAKEFRISPMLREHGIVSVANVPIRIDGGVWGVLEVDSTELRDFSQDTITFMTAAAAIMGGVVQRLNAERGVTEAVAAAAVESQNRELLLREMQHRVKNNFQFVLSTIAHQKRRMEHEQAQRALDHVANRINAISLAHDQLAPAQGPHVVDLAAYLRALCSNIGQQLETIAIEAEVDEVSLLIDRAVPLGLVVNEVITNCVKHAFGDAGGRITVKLTAGVGYGEARLTISDNGRGIQDDRGHGSGLKLVEALTRQIGGQFEQQSSSKGTTTTVVFPVIA